MEAEESEDDELKEMLHNRPKQPVSTNPTPVPPQIGEQKRLHDLEMLERLEEED